MRKDNEIPKEYVTPSSYVVGWLCVTFGSIPLLVGLNDKNKIALFIGIGMMVIGVVLLVIGKCQSGDIIRKLSEQKNRNHGKEEGQSHERKDVKRKD